MLLGDLSKSMSSGIDVRGDRGKLLDTVRDCGEGSSYSTTPGLATIITAASISVIVCMDPGNRLPGFRGL